MSRQAIWTVDRIVAAIRHFHHKTGRWPTTRDFLTAALLPNPATVHRHCGTLAEARRQAGAVDGGPEGHGGGGRGGGWSQKKKRKRS